MSMLALCVSFTTVHVAITELVLATEADILISSHRPEGMLSLLTQLSAHAQEGYGIYM